MSKSNSPIDSENTPTSGRSAQQSFWVRVGAWILNEHVAWIVLLLTLLVTLLAWKNAQEALLQAQQVQFENRASDVSDAILKRMQGYEHVLRGGVGLFVASESVTRTQWKDYVASQRVQEQYPGIQGIGFSVHIPATRLDAHLRTIRAEGFPDYAIRPAGVRAEYTSIIYLEPLDLRNQRAFGFDMFSEANRRAAMERARDTGGTSISSKVTLVQEDGKEVQAGMLMYLPYYKNGTPHNTLAERRANLVGYVYSPFRMGDLISGILGKYQTDADTEPNIDIEVYDGTQHSADSLLYDDDKIAHALGAPPPGSLTLTRHMDLYGHTWSLHFTTRPAFHAAFDKNKPLFILVVGTLLSVMLAGLIWMFATQHRRALEMSASLRDSERHERALLDNVDEGIVSISDTGMIELCNPAAERLFGYRSEEVVGKNVSILMPEPYHSEHDGYLGRYLHTGQAHIIGTGREVTAKRSDGSVFPMDLQVAEFFMGGRRHFIGSIQDITERKQAQDEILSLNANLEEQVQELHSQQEELRQSNEELEEKNQLLAEQKLKVEHKNREIEIAKLTLQERAEQLALTSQYKSEFLSSMSHELRTPLNSLLILAQLLAENPEHNLSEQQIEYAKIIQGAGKDLLELINDILDLSKIESGTVTPDLQDVSLANVREQVEQTFRHMAKSRGLGFGVELAPGLPPSLYTDSQRLQQVLKNLLSNAFKFTQQGQVSVRIAAVESGWSADHDGLNRAQTVIGFFVTDSGIGLAADKQKIIFEAFQQADTGTTKKYGGTGLGLSISRGIAWLLGGELHLVESELGQGSTFVLYLPLRAPESGQGITPKTTQRTPAAQEGAQETNPQPPAVADDRAAIKPEDRRQMLEKLYLSADSLAGKKVLVVDDDVRNIFALTAVLERHKMAVLSAENGRAALEQLVQNPDVDIVLMDIMMPEMDGFEAMRQIRQMKQFESLPMIALTAKAMKGDREKCIEAGASDYVSKPVDTDQLVSLLRVWLYR